ncbi:uncharacterized protein DUF3144 [Azomonas agilis]|uniref:Uncharacterized protein DUF3144 n=1 Tax=Azomonas agilis TaxID=116849 RepID=A0A562J1I9_9GAMM|nr:DUF3144 domain-containing protein [Azomonas agilis]TWH77141.1 uncharacterized protein DUF3144 [Azomonas agilis]
MSATNPAEEEVSSFFDLANQFIEVANRQLEEEEKTLEEVASAFRYAVARFTAYETVTRLGAIFSAEIEGLPNPDQVKEELLAKFVEQFRSMLDENLSEQIQAMSESEEEKQH